jgi:alanine racemase
VPKPIAPIADVLRSPAGSPLDLASGGELTIDLGAVEANYRHLAKLTGGVPCAGVVKADAYGVGAVEVTRRLLKAGCRTFFVAQLTEALALKPILPADATLAVLNGVAPGAEPLCADAGIVPVANSLPQLIAWGQHARSSGKVQPAFVQIDTGMSRLGLAPAEVDHLAANRHLLDGLRLDLIMSHLGCADDPDHPANAAQLAAFNAARAKLPPAPTSFANSAGIFLGSNYHFDLCRPGAAVYGLHVGSAAHGIRPVVTLRARVSQVREVPAGSYVGYGYTFQADRPMRLATIAAGYADGWIRSLGNRGAAWVDDVRLPIVGRVSMDSFTCDISALPEGRLAAGDLVDLLGAHQSADDAGLDAGTMGYEILTSLRHRYTRRYI